jgi:two-component system, OmpR family, sensor kinase
MSSLRARLVAGLVALAAAGLVVLGGVTYAEQRSFLLDRLDQQVHGAVFPLSEQLDQRSPNLPERPQPGDGDREHGPGGGAANFPYGTYGERRDANGRRVATLPLTQLGQSTPSTPTLPGKLPANRVVSVSAGGTRYRVVAVPDRFDTGTTVVAVPLREVDQTLHRLLLVEGLVIAGVLLALGVLAFAVVRLGLRPLDRIAATAGKIAGGDLSHRVEPATERTEVGRLGIALNGMLARLEEAFARREASEDRLRQFLADASHELRTPLSSIRGYAELHRMGAMDDTDTAMKRIEEEATRMGILVEDLLALARLDEIREPRRARVELDALARDAVDDARATAPNRDIALDAPAPAAVLGDPDQLRQVLANLLRNTLVHTPPGTPVEVTVRNDGDTAVLVVRDHGTGLPPGDPARLFERFWRAEAGRERGRGGAGLGLAIVGAIVTEHRGTVTAADAPAAGAVFTVRLPAARD